MKIINGWMMKLKKEIIDKKKLTLIELKKKFNRQNNKKI